MTQMSKERLEEIAGMQVKETSNGYEHAPEAYSNVRSVEIVEMARRLLAVEAQEPVGIVRYVNALGGRTGIHVSLYAINLPEGTELYAAPQPAPVAQPVQVPDEMTPEMMRAVQIKSELGAYAAANMAGAYDLFAEFWRVACRAAMLQPSQLPDGWKLVPVEPVAYLYSASFERGHVEGELTDAPGCDMPVYAATQPVAVPVVDLPSEFYSSEGVVVQLEKVMAALAVCGVKYKRKGNACRAAMLAAEPVSQPYKLPEGYVLVPVEPTMPMLDEFDSIIDYGAEDSKDAWSRMLAAAPQEPTK